MKCQSSEGFSRGHTSGNNKYINRETNKEMSNILFQKLSVEQDGKILEITIRKSETTR